MPELDSSALEDLHRHVKNKEQAAQAEEHAVPALEPRYRARMSLILGFSGACSTCSPGEVSGSHRSWNALRVLGNDEPLFPKINAALQDTA